MQQIVFNIPDRIFMGEDSFGRIAEEAVRFGNRAMIITDTNIDDTGLPARVLKILESRSISAIVFNKIWPGTTSEIINEATALVVSGKAQYIIGIGGVHTLSIARAVALLAPSVLRCSDYIDNARPTRPALPVFTIPTASRDPFMFTDSIMLIDSRTRNCVLKSTFSEYPVAVFIDPQISSTIPASTFTFIIMDTLMYAIEGYISAKCNFLSESLFLKAISAVVTFERRTDEDTEDPEAHEKAAKAGLVTAMGLSMAGPGFGAALSMVIAARTRAPRVLVSAVVLPIVLEYGIRVCPEKIARIAPILGEKVNDFSVLDAAERVVETIRHRIGLRRVQIRLSEFGITGDDLGPIADQVRKFDFVSQLPAGLATEDLVSMLRKIL